MKDNTSIWLENQTFPSFPSLDGDKKTEVLIVGAGIAGATTAYLLAKGGKKVTLIDRATPAESITAYTTAFLTQEIDTDLTDLLNIFGKEKTRLIWDSHGAAIDLVEQIVKDERIDCDFQRCFAYIYANDQDEHSLLQENQKASETIRLPITFHTEQELPFPTKGFQKIPHQAKFHPVKYLIGLLNAAKKYGASMYYNTEATKITHKPFTVQTNKGTIFPEKVIITTYSPFNNPVETFAKKGGYITYILTADIPKGKIKEGIYWDMHNPYHYFRIDSHSKKDRIIIGGEDHRKELPIDKEKNYKALETYLKHILQNEQYTITHRWDGLILENMAVALIGEIKENQLVATGFSGNGMTYGTIAGMMFNDSIQGKQNPWVELYSPKQLPNLKQLWTKTRDYTEEFIHGAVKNIVK